MESIVLVNDVNRIEGNTTDCFENSNVNHMKLKIPEFEYFDYSEDKAILFFHDTLQIYLVDKEIVDQLINLTKGDCNDFDFFKSVGGGLGGLCSINKNQLVEKKSNPAISKQIKKIFLHVSHDCNLKCGYCYAQGGTYGRNTKLMNLETAERAIDFIIHKNVEVSEFAIEFFGGEPMMNYTMIADLIPRIEKRYPQIQFVYGCVTNGTIVNDEILQMFQKYNFHVMLTIDGPKEYHDCQRVFLNGTGTFDTIYKNLPLLKQCIKDLSARIVYTRKNIELFTIYKYIYEVMEIKDISFRPVLTRDPEYALNQKDEEYLGDEICKVFDYYLERKLEGKNIEDKMFREIIKSLLEKSRKISFCDFGRFLSVTPEGNIYPCTHFVYNEEFLIGNTEDGSFNNDIWKQCIQSSNPDYNPCKKCWILGLCGGGCKGSAAFYHKDQVCTSDEFCNVRKKLVIHGLKRLVDLYLEEKLDDLASVLESKEEKCTISPDRWR